MTFYAANFIYNSVISSDYGLVISSLGSSTSHQGAGVELFTESLYRRPKVYLMGVQETPVLSLPITITREEEISAEEASAISKWLFGQVNYKKLQIIQPDMQYVYYNCIFTNPSITRVGNIIRGFNATIVCDSPFAWEYPKQQTYYYGTDYSTIDDDISYYNYSDSAIYTYPTVEVTTNCFVGDFDVINTTDNNRAFSFVDLPSNITLTINNDLQIVTSSDGVNRLESFSGYNWFRLLPGINRINLSGNIDKFRIINEVPKKIA